MRRLAFALAAWSLTAAATKPCPEDPCEDLQSCRTLARWVLVGRVVEIVHHRNPAPVFKDFAEFVVRVDKWEKGRFSVEKLHFQVGWCNNRRPPPDQMGARIRLYGDGDPAAGQYLALEELK